MISKQVLAALASAATLTTIEVDACTSLIAGKQVIHEYDSFPVVMHSADCTECDTRVALAPGRKFGEGAKNPIFGVKSDYPRQNSDRAWIYRGETPEGYIYNKPIFEIDQVEETYSIWESSYGLINEKGLVFGESSCNSKTQNAGVSVQDKQGKYGTAIFSVAELMRIALERCGDVICAIETMGEFATKYGFQGEDNDEGEAVTMADTNGDAWVFHILQDPSTNASAIWAAQRVPEGHVAVVANSFIIGEMPLEPNDDFKFSPNVRSEALKAKLWDGKEPFNFWKAYSDDGIGDYATIRMHWIYNSLAPSLGLTYTLNSMPFSVRVDKKVSIEDLANLYRNSYEGAEYDLTKGILSGPFGNPFRIEGGTGMREVRGSYGRGISIQRTSYTVMSTPWPMNPTAFYSTDTPATSVFIPFLASTLKEAHGKSNELTKHMYAEAYQIGDKSKFNWDSAWWSFSVIAQIVQLNYKNMTGEFVNPAIKQWQHKATMLVTETAPADNDLQVINDISCFQHPCQIGSSTQKAKELQAAVVVAWKDMFADLLVRYNDGFYSFYPGHNISKPFGTLGYPEKWLRDIHFDKENYWGKPIMIKDIVDHEIDNVCKHDLCPGAHPHEFYLQNGNQLDKVLDEEEHKKIIDEVTATLQLSIHNYLNHFISFVCGGLFVVVIIRLKNGFSNNNNNPSTTHLIYTNAYSNGYNSLIK